MEKSLSLKTNKQTRRGRPPVDAEGPGAQVRIRLTAAVYDELYLIAEEEGLDVPAVIREVITLHLAKDRRHCQRASA